MAEPLEKLQLDERTRLRSRSVWVETDWGGLMSPLAEQQADLNTLSQAGIESQMAISEETWSIKESQRDQSAAQSQKEVDQEALIADRKAVATRQKLALQSAANEYVFLARVWDSTVRGLLMGAKEFAALVELDQLAIEKDRAGLAISKEELRQKQVQAQTYYEFIQQAQVESDLAKAKVDVAKALVRALMADIEAGRAAIELIEAETQKYVAEADKATLQADVATIYVEILTKKLSAIKLDVGQKEITAGFAYIQSNLDDMLSLWDIRQATEQIRIEGENSVQTEIALSLLADKAQEDLRGTEADKNLEVFGHEKAKTAENLSSEMSLQAGLTESRLKLMDTKLHNTLQRDDQETWGQVMVYGAQQAVSGYRQIRRYSDNSDHTTLTVE